MHRLEEIKPRPAPNDNPGPYNQPPEGPGAVGREPSALGVRTDGRQPTADGPSPAHFREGAIPGETRRHSTSGPGTKDHGGDYVPQPGARPGERR